MPGMSGHQAHASIGGADPHARVVTVTSNLTAMGGLQECGPWPLVVVRKPFRQEEVVAALQMALEAWRR